MKFAKIVFILASTWSILILSPLFFLRTRLGQLDPPAITHPDYYFGFLCVGLSWAILFFIISTDPQRFRPAMIAAMVEKFAYGLFVVAFFLQGEATGGKAFFGCIDLLFGIFFLTSYLKTKNQTEETS